MRWETNVFIKPMGMDVNRMRERERLVCDCVQDWITRIMAIICYRKLIIKNDLAHSQLLKKIIITT